MKLRRPGDHTSTHLDHISTSRVTSILASTMVCIREHDKGLRLSRIRGIGNRVVNGTLNIAQEVFDSEPVGPARIGVQSSQYSNSVGDIWTSGGGKIHESTSSREVGSLMHGFSFLSILGAVSARTSRQYYLWESEIECLE